MTYKDSCFSPTCSKTKSVDYIIQTSLKENKKIFTGNTLHPVGLLEITTELFFKYTVYTTHLLFLAQLRPIIRYFDPSLTVLTRRVSSSFDGAFICKAAFAFQREFHILPAT